MIISQNNSKASGYLLDSRVLFGGSHVQKNSELLYVIVLFTYRSAGIAKSLHRLRSGLDNRRIGFHFPEKQQISLISAPYRLTLGAYKTKTKNKKLESASELYRPSDRRLSAKLVPTLADRGCRVVSATDPHGR
jgi:hypothetical protein